MVKVGYNQSQLVLITDGGKVCVGCCCSTINTISAGSYGDPELCILVSGTGTSYDGEYVQLWWDDTKGYYTKTPHDFTIRRGGSDIDIRMDVAFPLPGIDEQWKEEAECFPDHVRNETPELEWGYDTGGTRTWQILPLANGNVVVCGNRSGSKSVWCLDKDGVLQWDYDTGSSTYAATQLSTGDIVIVGTNSSSKSVWCLNTSGVLQWDYNAGGTSLVAIDKDDSDNVVVTGWGAGSKSVWSLDSDGNLNWDWWSGAQDTLQLMYDVVINTAGDAIVVGRQTVSGLYVCWSIDNTGSTNWSYAGGGIGQAYCVTLDSNERPIFGSSDYSDNVFCLTTAGVLTWSYRTGPAITVYDIAIDSEDNVIVVGQEDSNDYNLWSLDSNGNLNWRRQAISSNSLLTVLVNTADNTIYVPGYSDDLAKYSQDGELLWTITDCRPWGICFNMGALYVSGEDNGDYNIWKYPTASFVVVAFNPANYWANATEYEAFDIELNNHTMIVHTDMDYRCIAEHTSASNNQPGFGVDWQDYWKRLD
ncbi:hypothetical protein DRH27_01280 [Candidatus Falkowbacteria bacterium]|nr:MAG: hypothetical protein DRH27_01280 [Candidatus Falkowbacteria bacterium]